MKNQLELERDYERGRERISKRGKRPRMRTSKQERKVILKAPVSVRSPKLSTNESAQNLDG